MDWQVRCSGDEIVVYAIESSENNVCPIAEVDPSGTVTCSAQFETVRESAELTAMEQALRAARIEGESRAVKIASAEREAVIESLQIKLQAAELTLDEMRVLGVEGESESKA